MALSFCTGMAQKTAYNHLTHLRCDQKLFYAFDPISSMKNKSPILRAQE